MILPTLDFENKLWNLGISNVCGLDEVGRGSFAGPVVVGAVIFSPNSIIPKGIADSKLLSPKQRIKLAELIKKVALSYSVAQISVLDINKVGIGLATQKAFRRAIKLLAYHPDFCLIDAFFINHLNRKKQQAIKGGDRLCLSIAAASIIAKVFRDDLMTKLSKEYPNYGFEKNMGYGTKFHQEAIKKFGLSRIHRKSFKLEKFLY